MSFFTSVKTDETAALARGRRQDVFTIRTLLGVSGAATEADQQQAVAARELKRRTNQTPALWLSLQPGTLAPFDGWDINQKVTVEIANGRDTIGSPAGHRIVGVRGTLDEIGEDMSILVSPVLT